MKYRIYRTSTADELLRKIIFHIAENFGTDTAIRKLDDIENAINALADNPYMGETPRYNVLRRQGYRVLILEKGIVFYKVDDETKRVIIYAIVDQRQDYLSILKGL